VAKELHKTPPAPCRWAKILDPNGYKAYDESKPKEWSIELMLSSKDPDHFTFVEEAETLFDKNHPGERKGMYWWPGKEGDGDDKGLTLVRFKSTLRQFKDGNFTKPPVVLDKDEKPWPADKLIGNGSIVRVAFNVYAWKSSMMGAGMTFQPLYVMVMEHVPYTETTASSDGSPFGGGSSIF